MKQLKTEVATKDPGRKHFYISLVKSAVRITAGLSLCLGEMLLFASLYDAVVVAGVLLIAAEILGIAEDL
jgi:hypothetical protein